MDDLWYSEYHSPNVRFSIRVTQQLHHEHSDYQTVSVYDSPEFGRFLTLDGVLMLTERDEFIYHEMIVHVPMAVNPDIRDVLVIGAGDGGVARELGKYPGIRHIDIAEIDRRVTEVCREYLPQTACGFDDPRVELHIEDGLKYVRHTRKTYDLIIVDSTDPSGPGEVLFTREFYGSCFGALNDRGILINQHESPFYATDAQAMQSAHKRILSVFPVSRVYQAHIPTYPSGHWLFGFSSKGLTPLGDMDPLAWNRLGIQTRYYNTNLHCGAFYLPNYVEELLKRDE
ncbi:MAG TPA: polyamine aminopropyltransferase [Candidatus Limiplasma sp.]|nr:polyamine aminopropyltransferase [Candidatus Limiplasma sp.]HPS81312.1 polyamine aminopropyltransferase [Candidatus Limiplasma sp.]